MILKRILLVLSFGIIIYGISVYFSGSNVSQRDFDAMLSANKTDLTIIENYLNHHNQKTDIDYDKALLLAASLNNHYLQKVIDSFSAGNILLNTSTADLIIKQLPSSSTAHNYAAGRIFATNEFNHYQPEKAVKHLEYAALRGSRNAAATLTTLYAGANCYVEAITWAREANKRDVSSECTQLPVNINSLNEEQLGLIAYNEIELEIAAKENRLPELRYSSDCKLR